MMKKVLIGALLIPVFFFSQTGNAGIGTTDPQENLHVKGSLRLDHPSQGNGYILQVFDGGSAKWSPLIPNASSGTIGDDNGYNGDVPNDTYMYGQITLSPGKWLVKLSMLIPTDYNLNASTNPSSALRYNDIVIKLITYFSESATNSTKTTDYINGSATNITGSLITPSLFGMLEGYALLENSTTANKTYYVWGKTERNAVTSNPNVLPLYRLAAFWGENRIYALPIATN